MNSRKCLTWVAALITGLAFGAASAKLPAPSEEQKAKAAAAKAKAAEGAKKQAELLSKSQDRVAEHYKRTKMTKTSGAGKK